MSGAVTGGYNVEAREFAAGHSTEEGGGCAEMCVVNQLGGDPAKVRFTNAIRPRYGKLQEICASCGIRFRRNQSANPRTTCMTDRGLGGK
jgi:hypothetical protein